MREEVVYYEKLKTWVAMAQIIAFVIFLVFFIAGMLELEIPVGPAFLSNPAIILATYYAMIAVVIVIIVLILLGD